MLRGKTSSPYEFRIITQAGETRWILETVSSITYRGKPAVLGHALDITSRKQAETALRESQRKYRSLFDSLRDAAFLADTETGRIIETNRQAALLLGRSQDEIIGMHQSELHPQEAEYSRQVFEDHVQRTEVTDFHGAVINKEGHIIPVSVSASVLTLSGRRMALGLFRDISEHKRAEEALRESEARYRHIVNTAQEGIWTLDAEGTTTFVTQRMAEMLGYNASEMLGRAFTDFMDESARSQAGQYFERRRQGVEERHDFCFRRKDGSELWTIVSTTPLFSDEGAFIGALGMLVDITQRKRTEEALRESEELFRAVAQTAACAVFVLQDDTIRYMNPAGEAISGYKQEELLATNFWDVIHPDFRQTVRERSQARLRGENLEPRYEFKIITKDGAERWLDFAAALITYQGKPAGLATAFDITERKEMEQQLHITAQQWRTTFDALNSPLFLCDVEGRIRRCNRAMQELLGTGGDDIVGKHCWELVHGSQEPIDGCPLVRMRQSHRRESMTLTMSDRHFEVTVDPIVDDSGKLTAAVHIMRDVTESHQVEEMIRRLAYQDHLTGLPNRSLFNDRLGMALAAAQRNGNVLAVMFLDLDQFKDVNDSLGHSAGDRLLQQVGQRLQGLLRKSDTVARLGGDEFMFLLSAVPSGEYAIRVAERILDALRTPITIDGRSLTVTASIGVALYPSDGEDAETLMRNADTAMYRAKERGRDNCEPFNPEMFT